MLNFETLGQPYGNSGCMEVEINYFKQLNNEY